MKVGMKTFVYSSLIICLYLLNIFLSGFNRNIIFQINRKGEILKKIEYDTDSKGNRVSEFWATSLMCKNFTIIGSKMYIPQFPLKNVDIVGDDFDTFPLCATIDTVDNSIETLPLTYPHLWEKNDGIAHKTHYSFLFDGKQFIYLSKQKKTLLLLGG